MPRTKQTRKRGPSLTPSQEDVLLRLEDFEKQLAIALKELDDECETAVQRIKSRMDSALGRLPKEVREMTLSELLNEDLLDDDLNENGDGSSHENEYSSQNHPSSTRQPRKLKRQTAASTDDGYITEGTAPASQKKISKHVSRVDTKDKTSTTRSKRNTRMHSTSPSHRIAQPKKRDRSQSTVRKLKNNAFTTPAPSQSKTPQGVNLVTPKMKPNTPLNVLRHPRTGEVALSMQGSPLFVSAAGCDRMANLNVPLNNGNVMALLPKDGLRLSNIPYLDEDTKSQLETLKHHIEQVLNRD